MNTGPRVVQLDALVPQRCPCGWARRAFADLPGAAASMHLVEIAEDSTAHWHSKTTELYLVLAGEGEIELDGLRQRIGPMTAIYIPPGVRHRATGKLTLLNVPVPAFDPSDERFD